MGLMFMVCISLTWTILLFGGTFGGHIKRVEGNRIDDNRDTKKNRPPNDFYLAANESVFFTREKSHRPSITTTEKADSASAVVNVHLWTISTGYYVEDSDSERINYSTVLDGLTISDIEERVNTGPRLFSLKPVTSLSNYIYHRRYPDSRCGNRSGCVVDQRISSDLPLINETIDNDDTFRNSSWKNRSTRTGILSKIKKFRRQSPRFSDKTDDELIENVRVVRQVNYHPSWSQSFARAQPFDSLTMPPMIVRKRPPIPSGLNSLESSFNQLNYNNINPKAKKIVPRSNNIFRSYNRITRHFMNYNLYSHVNTPCGIYKPMPSATCRIPILTTAAPRTRSPAFSSEPPPCSIAQIDPCMTTVPSISTSYSCYSLTSTSTCISSSNPCLISSSTCISTSNPCLTSSSTCISTSNPCLTSSSPYITIPSNGLSSIWTCVSQSDSQPMCNNRCYAGGVTTPVDCGCQDSTTTKSTCKTKTTTATNATTDTTTPTCPFSKTSRHSKKVSHSTPGCPFTCNYTCSPIPYAKKGRKHVLSFDCPSVNCTKKPGKQRAPSTPASKNETSSEVTTESPKNTTDSPAAETTTSDKASKNTTDSPDKASKNTTDSSDKASKNTTDSPAAETTTSDKASKNTTVSKDGKSSSAMTTPASTNTTLPKSDKPGNATATVKTTTEAHSQKSRKTTKKARKK